MEKIVVEKKLDEVSLSIFYKSFREYTGCDWTLEQFIQSLKNQEYLKFLVFKKKDDIIGIVSYSTSNPWNKRMYDIEYSKDSESTQYMTEYKKEIFKKVIK